MPKPKQLDPATALNQLRKYCAYQERCHQDVRHKLLSLGIRGSDLENIVSHLIEENYLDEERFARSFVRGKFRNNHWGRHRLLVELTKRGVNEYLRTKALDEIEPMEYRNTLTELLQKKCSSLSELQTADRNLRLFKFGYQKGFEPELIYDVLKSELGHDLQQ